MNEPNQTEPKIPTTGLNQTPETAGDSALSAGPRQENAGNTTNAAAGKTGALYSGTSTVEVYRPSLKSLLLSYPVAYLYVCSMLFGFVLDPVNLSAGEGVDGIVRPWSKLVFAAVFLLWVVFVLREKEHRTAQALCGTRAACFESRFWMGCILFSAAAMALGRCDATNGYEIAALHGMAAYWVLCRGGALSESESGPFFVTDALRALVIEPFGNFFARLAGLGHAALEAGRSHKAKMKAKTFWVSAALAVLAVPVLFFAGSLLSEADDSFAALWTSVVEVLRFGKMPRQMSEVLVKLLWSLPVGAYLYGLVCGSVRRTKTDSEKAALRETIAPVLRVAPPAVLTAILTAFAALYALFFATQAGLLFGAFWGQLPERYTLSEYARQGFFQLCVVMALNFGLLGAAARLSETPLRRHAGLKGLSLVLMAESLLLAATAFSKLWLYISFFGFTPLRLLSSWAVLMLAAGVVLAAASILKPFQAVQKWLWLTAATFTLLCFY